MADDPTEDRTDAEGTDAPAPTEATVEDPVEATPAEETAEETAEDTQVTEDVEASEDGKDSEDGESTGAEPAAAEPITSDTETTKGTGAGDTATPTVVRRKVVSKRVTPKGGGPARSSGPGTKASRAAAEERASSPKRRRKDDDEEITFNDRYVPPGGANMDLPSPWWVPAIMFGLIIVGALVIMLNYMGALGDPSNWFLLIGLGFILAGIIVSTRLR